MICFGCDLRENGINLIVGMYQCGDHWHINALDVTDEKNPKPIDVLLSAAKIPSESDAIKLLVSIIQDFDPRHEEIEALAFDVYELDDRVNSAHSLYMPPMPSNPLVN